MSDTRPFQKLDDRLAGLPLDQTLHDGVPDWLEPALRRWLRDALTEDVAGRVAVNLRLSLGSSGVFFKTELIKSPRHDLLTVVDATLQLHPGWDLPNEFLDGFERFSGVLPQLEPGFP